jgi:hypothetical protein
MLKRIIFLCFAFIAANNIYSQKFEYYKFEPALVDDNVRSLETDITGNIWIGTTGGITKFDGINFTSYTTSQGLGGNIIYDIHAHSSGLVYAATSGGLSVFNGTTWLNYTVGDGLPSNNVWCVTEDLNGDIWIGTSDVGIAHYNGTYWESYSTSSGLISNTIKVIFADRNGNIWCGAGNGVSKFDGTNFKNFNTSNGLPGPIINDIIQLDNGNIAIATNNGISIYNFHNFTNITTAQGLPGANVLCLKQDFNQNLLIGTSSGFTIYNWTNFQTYTTDNGLSNNIVNKITISKSPAQNQVWIASPFNGVSVFDNNNTFVIYRTNKNLVNDNVTTIFNDNDITWIGTANGLNKVKEQNWRTFTTNDGLSTNYITAIHKDSQNNIWVGTVNGVNKISGLSITKILTAHGLTHPYVTSITSDETGKVYVATLDNITIIENGLVIDTISPDDGLADTAVNIVHYQDGLLWIMTDEAIQYYDGISFTDATNLGCATPLTASGGKSVNSTAFTALGDNNALRIYNTSVLLYNCYTHPYQNIATINSIVEHSTGLFCSFDNGEIKRLSSSTYNWEDFNTSYPGLNPLFIPSFISKDNNPNYLWIGSDNMGLAKACLTCNQNLTLTTISPSCYNSANGQISISSPAGTNYSIDNGQNWQASATFSGLKGGYYHILVQNATSEIIADSIYYLNHYSSSIADAHISITQINCFGNANGSIELTYILPATHIWENMDNSTFLRTNLNPGNYSVTVTDGAGCSKILSNTIVQPTELSVSENHTNINCYGSNNGQIQLNFSGGMPPYSVIWSSGQTTASISNLSEGNYSYTVSDNNSCVKTGTVYISEPDELNVIANVTNNECYGDLNGSIEISITGGVPNYNVSWTPNTYVSGNNIINAPAGTYNLQVVDANNCTFNSQYTINEPQGITISNINLSHVLCYGESTGSITYNVSGGFGDLSFVWTKDEIPGTYATTQNLTNIPSGTYHLTITDANNCSSSYNFTINQSPELVTNITVTPISCAGNEDGQLLATVTGGSGIISAYLWYNSQNQVIGVTPHITGLGAGDYYVVVRDSYYCYDTAYASLTQSTPHVYEVITNNASCFGKNDGSIQIIIDGGNGQGFNFNWYNGVAGNTNIANNLVAGTYSVTITDPTNCVEILQGTVTQPPMQDIGAFNQQEVICYGNSIILNPGNFVSYQWSTGETSPTITVFNEGLYYVRVIDANGCHLGDTVLIFVSTVYNNEKLNIATVTNDNKVKLIWNKTPNQGTEYFKIYKEINSNYVPVASIPYNQPAIFIDNDAIANEFPHSYKLSVVDSCGAESSLSPLHKTMKLEAVHDNNSVCYLNWSPYEGFFVVYYYIMKGNSPDNLQVFDSVLYNQYNYIQMNPNPNGTYYRIKVKRIDGSYPGDGNYYNEAYSNMVFCQNPTGLVLNPINAQQIYPNPFIDEINVSFSCFYEDNLTYSIYDISGKQVYAPQTFKTSYGNNHINIHADLKPGLYLLNIKFSDRVYNYRIVKMQE